MYFYSEVASTEVLFSTENIPFPIWNRPKDPRYAYICVENTEQRVCDIFGKSLFFVFA